MTNCIFCKIVAGEIPADVVRRDERVVAITDANPQAPVHILVMPAQHIATIGEFVQSAPPEQLRDLMAAAAQIGAARSPGGFRIVANTGAEGGQTVDHLHLHVIGGRAMRWPPG